MACAFDPEIALLLSTVGIFLTLSLAVALALLYSLASTDRQGTLSFPEDRLC